MNSIYILCIVAMIFLASIVNKSIYMEKNANRVYHKAIIFNILSYLGYIGRSYANENHFVLLNMISNSIIYISGCTTIFLFLSCNKKINKIIHRFTFALVILNIVFVLSSIWTRLIFEISGDGIYHRGKMYFLTPIIAVIIMICWITTLFSEYRRIPLKRKIHIFCLGAFEVLAILLQASDSSIKIEFIGGSFLLAIYYAFLIEVDGRIDKLTGVCSSRYYFSEVENLQYISGYVIFMIDANGLKATNDTKGHKVGDNLIIAVANAASHTFWGKGRVFRIGGDEFLVISTKIDESTIPKLIRNFTECLETESAKIGMKVTASIGCARHLKGEHFQETINRADADMYANKRTYYESLKK